MTVYNRYCESEHSMAEKTMYLVRSNTLDAVSLISDDHGKLDFKPLTWLERIKIQFLSDPQHRMQRSSDSCKTHL